MTETDNELKNDNISTTDTSDSDGGASDSHADRHDHGDQERSASVRESLRDAWREQTGEDPLQDEGREGRRKRDEERERRQMERRAEPKGRAAREAKYQTDAEAKAREADANKQTATDTAAQPEYSAFNADGSPKAWAAQARAEWQRLPKSVQDAIVKREKDTAAGVEAIKNRVAAEDRAWQPYDATIRQFGMDRAATVTRMMQWHQSLMQNPVASYPALARSQGHDQKMIVASVIAHNPDHFPQDVVNGALQGLGLGDKISPMRYLTVSK